jgi:ubiquinone/menaquinone biosynthesis C-methylase UbiE
MDKTKNHVCPVENAGSLDSRFRRWLQNPLRILSPYIKKGMTVLDFGCGPGYFTIDMARMVGKSGKVIAVDLQEGMLQKLRYKIRETEIEKRIELHLAEKDKIGVTEKIDFALAFYVVHEIPKQDEFFKELESILKPNRRVLVVEPPFHVSKSDFAETIAKAGGAGLEPVEGSKVFFSKTVILKKQ